MPIPGADGQIGWRALATGLVVVLVLLGGTYAVVFELPPTDAPPDERPVTATPSSGAAPTPTNDTETTTETPEATDTPSAGTGEPATETSNTPTETPAATETDTTAVPEDGGVNGGTGGGAATPTPTPTPDPEIDVDATGNTGGA